MDRIRRMQAELYSEPTESLAETPAAEAAPGMNLTFLCWCWCWNAAICYLLILVCQGHRYFVSPQHAGECVPGNQQACALGKLHAFFGCERGT
jgi:hypothetical protein